MEQDIIGGLLGGLGLLLLGMFLMTNGLRLAAGKRLNAVLYKGTKTRIRGVFSGTLITSLVQSSSATTVATLGFVNASLMNLHQAVAVIYGSNIGTTMTAWLVTLVGFNVDIKAFALPAIGLGMGMRLVSNSKELGYYGEALAGFGVFFLGIEILKTTFGDFGTQLEFAHLDSGGVGLLGLVGIGFLMTVLMQSSSASMAIILTAVGSGVLPYYGAAAMIIGANVGTTSTAMLGVIGATPNAKRAAAAHVLFNLITGVVALLLLPLLLQLAFLGQEQASGDTSPMVILALFHTLFNLLGVILMWPITNPMVAFLKTRFRSTEEDAARSMYLDSTLINTPYVAIDALKEELTRISDITRNAAKAVISAELEPGPQLDADKHVINKLILATSDYSTALQRTNLSVDIAEILPNGLRISGYYNNVMEMVEEIAQQLQQYREIQDPNLSQELNDFHSDVVSMIDLVDTTSEDYDHEKCLAKINELEVEYQTLKKHLLRAGTTDSISAPAMVHELEMLSHMHRLVQQLEKGARYLSEFGLKENLGDGEL